MFSNVCRWTRRAPWTDKRTGEEIKRTWGAGFKPGARFGYEQTEGEELPDRVSDREFLDALPLAGVARSWGLKIQTYGDATKVGSAGWFAHDGDKGKAIGLGVENLSTWTHELTHAADLKLGALKKTQRPELSNEVVAELGGAVLLQLRPPAQPLTLGGNSTLWPMRSIASSRMDRSRGGTFSVRIAPTVSSVGDLICSFITPEP